eukprot:1054489-Alexandrium_andersonii.AAC.1
MIQLLQLIVRLPPLPLRAAGAHAMRALRSVLRMQSHWGPVERNTVALHLGWNFSPLSLNGHAAES